MNQELRKLMYHSEEVLMNNNFSLDKVNKFKKYWKQFKDYCEDNDILSFTDKTIYSFLLEQYNINFSEQKILSKKENKIVESMKALINIDEFVINYMSSIKINRRIILSNYYDDLLDNYLKYCKEILNNKETTIKDKQVLAKQFLYYLESKNIRNIAEMSKDIINKYIDDNTEPISRRIRICWSLKCLFNYLFTEELVKTNYAYLIPVINRNTKNSIPTVFEKEDVEKILNYLKEDKTNIASRRHYAMILIAARLGLRGIDIKHLKWSDINWNEKTIYIIQEKTNKPVKLPLTNDIGDAIIDYIKYERPFKIKKEDDYIFIRHLFPYIKLSDSFSFHHIIKRVANKIGIDLSKYEKKGIHSFRRTLATSLLNNNVPITTISSTLGHCNIDSTKQYLRTNEEKLEECFCEVEGEL